MKQLPAETVKVKLYGRELWLLSGVDGLPGRALAPPEDCDDHGNVQLDGLVGMMERLNGLASGGSFAHLYDDGEIKRFGEVIGTADDLEVL